MCLKDMTNKQEILSPIALNGIPTMSLVAKDLYSNSGFWLDKQK